MAPRRDIAAPEATTTSVYIYIYSVCTYPICGVRPRPFSNARRRERHPCRCRARLVAAPRSSSVQLPTAGTLMASGAVTAAAVATMMSTKARDDDDARAMAGRAGGRSAAGAAAECRAETRRAGGDCEEGWVGGVVGLGTRLLGRPLYSRYLVRAAGPTVALILRSLFTLTCVVG